MALTPKGIFIALFDDDSTLALYVQEGVYGMHMPPTPSGPGRYSRHFHALADYAAIRKEDHVFFFTRRYIYYGGQIDSTAQSPGFFLNGQNSQLGVSAKAPLCWDESTRTPIYEPAQGAGIFTRVRDEKAREVSQPYILRFSDKLGLQGRRIMTDDLYLALSKFPLPLPSNVMEKMGFCTITPAESSTAVELLKGAPRHRMDDHDEPTHIVGTPVAYGSKFGLASLSTISSEAQLEATVLANPSLLPPPLRPNGPALRQVPVSPFKPTQMDKADICYYDADFGDGAVPTLMIELKKDPITNKHIRQLGRYLNWLDLRVPEIAGDIEYFLFGPSISTRAVIPNELGGRVVAYDFVGNKLA